jgi:hypothetical protein
MADNADQDPPHFIPRFIQRQLDNPPILPGESAVEFRSLFREFEFSEQGGDRTAADYVMIFQVTLLTWRLLGLERMRAALIRHQRPAAVVGLLKRTDDLRGVEPGSLAFADVSGEVAGYFTSEDARKKMETKLAAAGYAPESVDVEAFQLSLHSLATIDRQVASAQKQLMAFLKEIDRRETRRADALRGTALNAISRVRSPVAGKGQAS